MEIDYESDGSTTWRKRVKMAGLEPDNCFYFQNEAIVRGRLDLDLRKGNPPPDLALEIDITNKSLDRFPIYAAHPTTAATDRNPPIGRATGDPAGHS